MSSVGPLATQEMVAKFKPDKRLFQIGSPDGILFNGRISRVRDEAAEALDRANGVVSVPVYECWLQAHDFRVVSKGETAEIAMVGALQSEQFLARMAAWGAAVADATPSRIITLEHGR